LRSVAILLPLLLAGCLSVTREPDPPHTLAGAPLPARIDYHGNPRFLPASVAEAAPDATDTLDVVYRTETQYENSSPLHLLNPLLEFGYPGIGTDLTVSGRLEIRDGAELLKRYEAQCVVKMRRSIYRLRGPSQTELRAEGLVVVRELIEAQMLGDAVALEALPGGDE